MRPTELALWETIRHVVAGTQTPPLLEKSWQPVDSVVESRRLLKELF
jgi:hypothetical protein